ncbi:hypothetical protein ACWEN3_13975 [Streptomyces sp. NPDC004561]
MAELYRTKAPRVEQLTESDDSGDKLVAFEQLVPMSRQHAVHYFALKWAVVAACPQTTVSAVGFKQVPAQTLRFARTKAQMGDESFVQETTTWNGGSAAPSSTPNAGERAYTIYIRMGSVILIYGECPTKSAALAAGAKAAAHARSVLLRTARG